MRTIGCVLALGWASSAHALQRPMSLGALCAHSESVVVGEVTGLEAIFAADGSGRIETWADVHVLRTLRGDPTVRDMRIVLPGGEAAGLRLTVEDSPRLQTDARYLLMLSPRQAPNGARDAWVVNGGEAGARPVQEVGAVGLADLGGCHGG